MSHWEVLTPEILQSATWREDGLRRFCNTEFGTIYEISGDYFLADTSRVTRLEQDGNRYLREVGPGSFEGPVSRLVHDGPWDAAIHELKSHWPLIAACYVVAMVVTFTGLSRTWTAFACMLCLMLALIWADDSRGVARYLKAALLAPMAYGVLVLAWLAADFLLNVVGFSMGLLPIEALTGYFSGE